MKRRILAMLMSLVLMIGILPVTALAAEIVDSGKCGDNLTWTLDEDGVLTISGEGDMWEFSSDNQPQWSEYMWSNDSNTITKVVVNQGVTSIGYRAFYFCTNLITVEIPASVTKIGLEAFLFCNNLESICVNENNQYYTSDKGVLFSKDKSILIQAPSNGVREKYVVPDGIEYIGYYSFLYCEDMTEIVLPDSLLGIEEGAFSVCGLTSVDIPNGTTRIGAYAFHWCENLKRVDIPTSVINIEDDAFYSCVSLEQITVEENNLNYSSDKNGSLLNKEKSELIKVPSRIIGNYTIPEGVCTVKQHAFEVCRRLNSITVPKSVRYFEDYAITSCYKLTEVIVAEENEYFSNDENGILYNAEKSEIIYIPGGMNRSYTVNSSVTIIGDWALIDIDSLPEIIFVGDAPEYSGIYSIETTMYYPANNPTWTKEAMENFGDEITWIPYTPSDHLQGDVDGNGELSNTDLIMVARYIVELYDENTKSDIETYGDMNGDGNVTNIDLITMARTIVGLE